MATVFAESGFEAHAGWRISEPDMKDMMDAHALEFVWRGSKVGGEATELLSTAVILIESNVRPVHLLPWSYTCPGEFLFEDRIIALLDDRMIADLGVRLAAEAKERAKYTRHRPHVMWLWGTNARVVI